MSKEYEMGKEFVGQCYGILVQRVLEYRKLKAVSCLFISHLALPSLWSFYWRSVFVLILVHSDNKNAFPRDSLIGWNHASWSEGH
jgi:hypothetical protein